MIKQHQIEWIFRITHFNFISNINRKRDKKLDNLYKNNNDITIHLEDKPDTEIIKYFQGSQLAIAKIFIIIFFFTLRIYLH